MKTLAFFIGNYFVFSALLLGLINGDEFDCSRWFRQIYTRACGLRKKRSIPEFGENNHSNMLLDSDDFDIGLPGRRVSNHVGEDGRMYYEAQIPGKDPGWTTTYATRNPFSGRGLYRPTKKWMSKYGQYASGGAEMERAKRNNEELRRKVMDCCHMRRGQCTEMDFGPGLCP